MFQYLSMTRTINNKDGGARNLFFLNNTLILFIILQTINEETFDIKVEKNQSNGSRHPARVKQECVLCMNCSYA